MSQYSAFAWLAALLCLVRLVLRSATQCKAQPLPPGPTGLPIIGNALQMPREHIERGLAKLAERYGTLRGIPFPGVSMLTLSLKGDLTYMEVLGIRMVIVNSQTVARDLLEKRGAKYSNRPRMVRLNEV